MSKIKIGDKIQILCDGVQSAEVVKGEVLTLHSYESDGALVVMSEDGFPWSFSQSSEGLDWQRYPVEVVIVPTEVEQELLLAIRAGKIAMPVIPKPKQQVTKTCSAWVFPSGPFHAGNILDESYNGAVPCKVTVEYEV